MPLPCRSGSPPARRSRFDAPPDNAAAAAQQAALAALQQQQLQKQLLAQQQLMQQQARTSPLRFLFRPVHCKSDTPPPASGRNLF